MKTNHPPVWIFSCGALVFFIAGCADHNNAPIEPPEGTWSVLGKAYFLGSREPAAGALVACGHIKAITKEDGSYLLSGVAAGKQTLTAEAASCEKFVDSIDIESNVTFHVYLRRISTTLSGYVSNAVEGPIEGARVVFGRYAAYSDVSGKYQFLNIKRDSGALSVSHPSYLASNVPIALNQPTLELDIVLKKDSIVLGNLSVDTYVDETYPTRAFYHETFLYLRADGYDNDAYYESNIERRIYLKFDIPSILNDERVSVLEGSLEICATQPFPAFEYRTYSVSAEWPYTVTYANQPLADALLESGFIGDSTSAKYWRVLGADGIKRLLDDWRRTGKNHGIVVKGGTSAPAPFYSSDSVQNRPRVSFKVRF